jgi:hypothetical protein
MDLILGAHGSEMKFVDTRPFADPEAAARKLIELANAVEVAQDGRIHIEKINGPMLFQLKATPAEYKAASIAPSPIAGWRCTRAVLSYVLPRRVRTCSHRNYSRLGSLLLGLKRFRLPGFRDPSKPSVLRSISCADDNQWRLPVRLGSRVNGSALVR